MLHNKKGQDAHENFIDDLMRKILVWGKCGKIDEY